MHPSDPDTFISIATSSDENHSPENMLDGKTHTFWITTGTYPQEFVVSFKAPRDIKSIKIVAVNINTLKLETCKNSEPVNYQINTTKVAPKALPGDSQLFEMNVNNCDNVRHLRFTIQDALDHFCCVRSVEIQ